MDTIDRATEYVNEAMERAREEQRRRREREALLPAGSEDCLECGEGIPAARRAAVPGVELCVDCQGLAELKNRQ